MKRLVPRIRVARAVQTRPALDVLGVGVRAELQQQLGHIDIAERRGLVQARVPRSGFLGVHGRTLRVRVAGGLDGLAHGVDVARLDREDQRGLLHGVVRHGRRRAPPRVTVPAQGRGTRHRGKKKNRDRTKNGLEGAAGACPCATKGGARIFAARRACVAGGIPRPTKTRGR